MKYDTAITKAWLEIKPLTKDTSASVRFLNDTYSIDLVDEKVFSESCNIPPKEHITLLVLHYLIKKFKGLPAIDGEWVSFKQLIGGAGYYPVFKKRVLEPIRRKYGDNPDTLSRLIERFRAKRAQLADISIVLETFEGVPVLITLYRGDDEFGPEVNMLYDRNISDILCTEDVVVLSEIIAHTI